MTMPGLGLTGLKGTQIVGSISYTLVNGFVAFVAFTWEPPINLLR
jgi:hypothetical protein